MAKRPHLSVLDYSTEACRALKARLDELHIACDVIAGYTNFSADAEHPDIPHREIQVQHVTELSRMARDLGAGVVRIFTAYQHPRFAAHTLVDTLREAAARAADHGVVLGIQNHHDTAVGHLSLIDLLEAVDHPNCRACFDAWAPALQGEDLGAAARLMAPWTCHTTAADYQMRPRFKYNPSLVNYEPQTPATQMVPMGEGFIDYRAFLGALSEGGYKGPVAFEMCAPLKGGGSIENLDRCAKQFLGYLSPL
jgi:sugar phosphate isomerase/epimerase